MPQMEKSEISHENSSPAEVEVGSKEDVKDLNIAIENEMDDTEASGTYPLIGQNVKLLVEDRTDEVAATKNIGKMSQDDVVQNVMDQSSSQNLGYYPMPRLEFLKF